MIDAVAAVPGPRRFRTFRGEEDFPAMLRVYTAAHEADGIEEVTTLDDLRRNYANLVNCDPARDIFVAEIDGEVVAYARVFWQELVEGGRSYENFGFVHPAWRRRGIGGALHRMNEDRLREIAAEHRGRRAEVARIREHRRRRRRRRPPARRRLRAGTVLLRDGAPSLSRASSRRRCPTASSCAR